MKPIPGPKSVPVFGTILSIMAAGGASKLHLYVDERHKQFGPIYREKIGSVSGVFVADGDYIRKIFASEGKYPRHIVPEAWILYNRMHNCKRGLLFMDGEEWFGFRKTMNNLMLKVSGDEFRPAASVAAQNLVENWKREIVVNDLERQLYKWSLEVMVAVLMGSEKYRRSQSDLSPLIEELSRNVHRIFIESAKLSLLPVKMMAAMRFPVWKRFALAASSTVEQEENGKGKMAKSEPSFVQTMFNATLSHNPKELGKKISEKLLELEKKNDGGRGGLLKNFLSTETSLEDLKRIVIDLILAAGDTTAHIMQWLLHLLSIELPSQTRIFNELMNHSDEDVFNCPLLKGSLKEALRLYPVAPFITRFMPESVLLDDYEIEANELVLMSMYTTGRNGHYFPEPDSFRPERWLRDGRGAYQGVLNPNGSLPFALGPRSCVGRKIAETQILVTLSQILRNFELRSDRRSPIETVLHLISVPEEPVKLILKPRK